MAASLAPGLLLASPPLGDPNFDRTVVLLAVHSDAGALGFVVNRRAEFKVGQVLTLAGIRASDTCEACPVLLGGPVEPSSGWVMGRDLEIPEGADRLDVSEHVRITRSKRAFETLASEIGSTERLADPKRRVVILGYSGWGPGQVEREIASGSWLPVAFDASVLFDIEMSQRWERAYALQGISPAGLMSMRTVGLA